MTDKERIQRLEFLIRLMVVYVGCTEAGEPSAVVGEIIDEYCEMHDIDNPFSAE